MTAPIGVPPAGRWEINPFTRALVARIVAAADGDIIGYADLNTVAHCDVQSEGRHLLRSARRIARREHAVVTDFVVNVGIERATPERATEVAYAFARKSDARVRDGLATIVTVDMTKLSPEARVGAMFVQAGLALRRMFGRRSVDRQLRAAVEAGPLKLVRPSSDDLQRLFRRP